jgi:hypothetical protein
MTNFDLDFPCKFETTTINGKLYVIGYMSFVYDCIYCFNKYKKDDEILWNDDLVGKEFKSDYFNKLERYGFNCHNTIDENFKQCFNSGFLPEHVIKVIMPAENIYYEKVYGVYNTFWSNKINIVSIIEDFK